MTPPATHPAGAIRRAAFAHAKCASSAAEAGSVRKSASRPVLQRTDNPGRRDILTLSPGSARRWPVEDVQRALGDVDADRLVDGAWKSLSTFTVIVSVAAAAVTSEWSPISSMA